MATPNRTWTLTNNVAPSNQSDQVIQFQEAMWYFKELLVAAGWSIDRSSNGSTAGAGDNWASPGDVALGTAGNGAWAAFTSPAGFAGGDTVYCRFWVTDTGSNPQTMEIELATQPYTGGTTSSLPTTAGATAAAGTNTNIIPWTSVMNGFFNYGRSDQGDVWFSTKAQGASPGYFFAVTANRDGDGGGFGRYRAALITAGTTTSGVTSNDIQTQTFTPDGAAGAQGRLLFVLGDTAATLGWTGGLDFDGDAIDAPLLLTQSGGLTRRFLGDFVDFYQVPNGLPVGELDASEAAQAQRRVVLFQGLMAFVNDADLPLT